MLADSMGKGMVRGPVWRVPSQAMHRLAQGPDPRHSPGARQQGRRLVPGVPRGHLVVPSLSSPLRAWTDLPPSRGS